MWSADEDKVQPIYAIGRTGQPSDAKGEFDRPIGVCCSPDGSFSVAEYFNYRVQRFDASGRFLTTFGSRGKHEDQFQYPFDVRHLHHHFPFIICLVSFLVTDNCNKHLSIWSGDCHQHTSTNTTRINLHLDVDDLNGFMNVSCYSPDLLFVFMIHASYQLLQTLGDGTKGSAPDQFDCPTGMCVDDLNNLMVVDH